MSIFGRTAGALSAVGAVALVAGGLALGAVAAPGSQVGPEGAPGAQAAAVDVAVPASGAQLVCPGAPVLPSGDAAATPARGAAAAGAAAAASVASGTTGLVLGGGPGALSGRPLLQHSGGTGGTDGSDTPQAAAGAQLGDVQRVAVDGAAASTGAATGLSAGPVDGHAPLLAGATASVTTAGDLRGLSAPACVRPAEQTWLVGGGTGAGRSTRLVLADVAQTPTTVDVTVLTAQGAQQPSALQGLSVGPGEQRSVLLEGALAGTGGGTGDGAAGAAGAAGAPLAVQVRSSAGPVAAWLVETVLHGLVPGGTDVVGPAAAPSTSLVVPGVATAGSQPAVLRLANPGADPVVARFAVVGTSGASVPSGTAPATAVPAQSVVDVPLASLPAGGVALSVQADGPVLAGVRTDSAPAPDGSRPGDLAWSAAVDPLAGATLVAVPPAAKTGRSGSVTTPDVRLVLSSEGASEVDVAVVGADGRTSGARRVELPASTTTAADVDDLARAAGAQGVPIALLLTPVAPVEGAKDAGKDGAGQVVAALTSRVPASGGDGGDLVSVAPVAGGAQVPAAVPVTITSP
ncbi:hypothetical protein SAMN06264364_11592 [Quadrisphaera granulorum]|uniref:Uncharacterized protein n=1 Tax=Quadrisphaera granulorum TaxID=317664 RepID=A0A316A8C5_9ACTN|nr:DUF5719 family protein [Quadrisphaera granulorum]PWJ53074.1 hypothetical protein BXY45_11592 [Quadrisphaera granulorum]SZE97239.1 hypothetical protein SAMN06264364_11592 [Quadrisphaera granulorum]